AHLSWKLSPEALARGSARRPWLTVACWTAALAAAAVVVAGLLNQALTTEQNFTNNPESKRAELLLQERLRGPERVRETVIVRSPTLTVDQPAFREFVTQLYEAVTGLGPDIIAAGTSYYLTPDPSLVSMDRRATILPFVMAGTLDDADANIERVHEVIRAQNGQSGFQVLIAGAATIGKDFNRLAEQDLRTAELFSIPITLVVLLLVFGAVVAGLVPLLLAGISIVAALGATALIGLVFNFSFFVTNMITVMGLAVGIDYSLFILSRFREERERGRDKVEAIAAAGATASRAVLFSGLTVVFALLGLMIVPTNIFRSLAAGAILVVVVAVAASLTLLPAALSLLGDRINVLRVPVIGRRPQAAGGAGNLWGRLVRGVMRHPVLSVVASGGLLVAAALPSLGLDIGLAGVETMPDTLESKQAFLVLKNEFRAGLVAPAEIVVNADVNSPEVQEAVQRLRDRLTTDPAFGPSQLQANAQGNLAVITTALKSEATAEESLTAIRRLRADYIPAAFAGVNGEVLVTGPTAADIDFFDMTGNYTPIVFAFVLGLSFLLLTVVFRSLVVPLKAILMNLLSVGAAYGLMVIVFEKGIGAGFLGFQQVETIDAWIPLFLFAMLFGLSMDYHVFLLSRIRERFDETSDNSESVAFG
ncbi:MAG: MMPL family transporter, partial [SAR202 cluster bacterium]|nr:MMPL family transporter [SAR202 cluster bacterium]